MLGPQRFHWSALAAPNHDRNGDPQVMAKVSSPLVHTDIGTKRIVGRSATPASRYKRRLLMQS